jgi:hypothetical protein
LAKLEGVDMDLVKLHNDSKALLERLTDRLPQDIVKSYKSYSDAGEWIELINLLCASLVKRNIQITPAERNALKNLLCRFQVPIEGYDFINNRNETLASLNVVDG